MSRDIVPQLDEALPKRGNLITRSLGLTIMRATGWRVGGEIPNLPKFVAIVAPHTSNWDFVHGMAAAFALGLRVSWMGKNTLFRKPFGGVMRWLGGVSIDRSAPHGVVKQTVDIFSSRSQLVLGITPEGTRSKVDQWKMGFYHIAKGSGLPIVPVYFDYPERTIGFGKPIIPGEDFDSDLQTIIDFYRGHMGKHPQNQTYS